MPFPQFRPLRPYTVVVSVCRVGRSIGVAKSDPYLSAATAVGSATRRSELRHLLADIPVGAIVIAQPMHGCRAFAHRPLAQSLARINRDCRFVAWDARATLADARREAADNDQWVETGVSEVRRRAAPHVHAAVALQAALDQEMGGWPNTFG